jgi:hypothetical protein
MSNSNEENKLHKLACEMPLATNVLEGVGIVLVAVGIILIGLSYIGATGRNALPGEILSVLRLGGFFMFFVCYSFWKFAGKFNSTVKAMKMILDIEWCDAALFLIKQELKKSNDLPWGVVKSAISLQRQHGRNLNKENELTGRRAAADAILAKGSFAKK